MAIISIPSNVYFDNVDSLKLHRGGMSMRSRYTGKRQVINYPMAVWMLSATTIKLDGTDAGQWRAFLASLVGTKNTFRLPVPGTETGPLSGFNGTAVVGTGGAAVGATTMPITTTGGASSFLKVGDYFTVNDELKLCTAACATGTNVTLTFEPFLRSAVTAGMAITTTSPTCLMSAVDDDVADWSLEHPVLHQVKLKCIEAF